MKASAKARALSSLNASIARPMIAASSGLVRSCGLTTIRAKIAPKIRSANGSLMFGMVGLFRAASSVRMRSSFVAQEASRPRPGPRCSMNRMPAAAASSAMVVRGKCPPSGMPSRFASAWADG